MWARLPGTGPPHHQSHINGQSPKKKVFPDEAKTVRRLNDISIPINISEISFNNTNLVRKIE